MINENNLVAIKGDELTVTSLVIADGAGYDHDTVIRLVRKHIGDLQQFGLVGFEIRARLEGQHGGGDTQYAVLNEQQSALILTYMRNSPAVREFKIRLVKEFYAMRAKLSDPKQATPVADMSSAIMLAHNVLLTVPGLNAGLAASVTLRLIADQTGLDTEPMRKLLPALTEPAPALNATAVGEKLGISARMANMILAEKGLQFKNSRGEWEITESGKAYGGMVPFTRNGHSSYQPLWKPEVIAALDGAHHE